MTLIKDIYEYIDSFAPFDTQASWDNSGLLVGSPLLRVTKVMLCLDITDNVIAEAKQEGCELIISHHPVIFSPLRNIDSTSTIYKLIQSGISALCVHTNLDIAQDTGVNICLAEKLQLSNTKLYPEDFLCIGELEHIMSDDEFALYVKKALSCNGVRYTNGCSIKTVAVSSGGGSDAVQLKEKYNFDAIVTGEIKHHHFIYAQQNNFCAVEGGHFNTEDIVIAPLKKKLSGYFNDVEFVKSVSLTDPANFV